MICRIEGEGIWLQNPLELARKLQMFSSNVMFHLNVFNPKECGLFGQLDMRGGMESTHFGKRSLTPPNFIL